MVFLRRDDDEELEVPEDEEATLADDILDEVEEESTDLVGAEEIEGFGLIDEAAIKEEEEKEEGEGEEGDAPLEEDAEDVDFDTFDDVDEL
jgi:hypothetical protein